jgi:hypothetical protein
MNRETLKVELELVTAEEFKEDTNYKYYLRVKDSGGSYVLDSGDTLDDFDTFFGDFIAQEIAKIEAPKWQPKEGDWARGAIDKLVKVMSLPVNHGNNYSAHVKFQNGVESETRYWLKPIGDWRVGDVLEDGEGDIIEITCLRQNDGAVGHSVKNGSGFTFDSSGDYSKTLKPCFHPVAEAKPGPIAEVKKMVIDGLNELIKKISAIDLKEIM